MVILDLNQTRIDWWQYQILKMFFDKIAAKILAQNRLIYIFNLGQLGWLFETLVRLKVFIGTLRARIYI